MTGVVILAAACAGTPALVCWYIGAKVTGPPPRKRGERIAWALTTVLGAAIGLGLLASAGWPWLVTR